MLRLIRFLDIGNALAQRDIVVGLLLLTLPVLYAPLTKQKKSTLIVFVYILS